MSGIATAIVGSAVVGGVVSSRAAKGAAAAQSESSAESVAFQRESRDIAREDLQPFRDFGESQIQPLNNLLENPNSYLQNNPLYDAINNNAKREVFANRAARGKLGSGGTARELQNRFLANGESLINNQYNRLLGGVSSGQNAAAGQANVAQNTGVNVGNTLLQKGNAIAAGKVGSANAINNALNQSVGLLSYNGYLGKSAPAAG